MRLQQVIDTLDAEVLSGKALVANTDVASAFSSDMMSDVLAFAHDQSLLLTGLVNPQVVRTAEMMDISVIAFVRGKKPDATVVELADEKGIVLLSTALRMYPACGKLYAAGLAAGEGL